MAIDGLIVLEGSSTRPIATTAFRGFGPGYALLHIDAHVAAPDEPVVFVPSAGAPSACAAVRHGALAFLCPLSADSDPAYALAFIHAFVAVLADYFGDVSPATLRDHFDVVYQLLEETLDAGGHPLTTTPSVLKEIVTPPSLFSKLLNAAGVPDLAPPPPAASALGGPIPWRKPGIRYNANEIYFDVTETLHAVVGANGAAVSARIAGRVDANARLSGTPDLALGFAEPAARALAHAAFHPCVRLARWAQTRVLSFVPPDGKFALMDYALDTALLGAQANTALQVPLHLATHVRTHDRGGSFEFVLTSRQSRALEDVSLELYLGAGATGASCAAGAGAEWSFVPARQVLRWAIPVVQQGAGRWTLQGTFSSSDAHPFPARAVQVRYSISSHLYSGLKVDTLRMTGETYKPYKGVRGRADGVVEWRVDVQHEA